MMLTLPPADRRAALLHALESLVASAGPTRPSGTAVTPESVALAFERGGVRRVAMLIFRAAGMAEPEVVMMGGNGDATAFRTHGKTVVRAGAELAPELAVVSAIRAASAMWRQLDELDPAASEDEEIATSAYLSLAAVEAHAALIAGERSRAEALAFVTAARCVAQGEPGATARMAWDLGPPLDALYEDGLRLLAQRRDELRARLQLDVSAAADEPRDLVGTDAIRVDGSERIADALAARPCSCGGRWRVVKVPEPIDSGQQQVAVACRVCLRWRDVLFEIAPSSASTALR